MFCSSSKGEFINKNSGCVCRVGEYWIRKSIEMEILG